MCIRIVTETDIERLIDQTVKSGMLLYKSFPKDMFTFSFFYPREKLSGMSRKMEEITIETFKRTSEKHKTEYNLVYTGFPYDIPRTIEIEEIKPGVSIPATAAFYKSQIQISIDRTSKIKDAFFYFLSINLEKNINKDRVAIFEKREY